MKTYLMIALSAVTAVAQEADSTPLQPIQTAPSYSIEEITYLQGELLQIMREMGKIDSLNTADEWAEMTPAIDILMQQLDQAGIDPQNMLEINGLGETWILQQVERLNSNGFYGSQKLAAALGLSIMPPCPYTAEELSAAQQRMVEIALESISLLEAVNNKETADTAADQINKFEAEMVELDPMRNYMDHNQFLDILKEKGFTAERLDTVSEHLRSKDFYGSEKLKNLKL